MPVNPSDRRESVALGVQDEVAIPGLVVEAVVKVNVAELYEVEETVVRFSGVALVSP